MYLTTLHRFLAIFFHISGITLLGFYYSELAKGA